MAKQRTVAALCLLATLAFHASGAAAAPDSSCPATFLPLDGRCVHIYTDYYEGQAPPMTWPSAKNLCGAMATDGWTTDLATLTESFLSAFSAHVVSELQGMTGFIFWTGANKVDGVWQWADTSPIDHMSYFWYMSSPNPESTGVHGMLVPSGANNRFYMMEYGADSVGPSFVCEAMPVAV